MFLFFKDFLVIFTILPLVTTKPSSFLNVLKDDVQFGEFNPGKIENIIPKYRSLKLDPEAYMTVEEIIHYHGYPVITYQVQTKDGYILTIHRIPHGKNKTNSGQRKAVLIQHGMFCSSASWVSNVADKNLPYLLADAEFDVWLGNVRGTLFGRNHTKLSPNSKEFWEFSFDEMGKFDLPAVIDLILKTTGLQQIDYIGHSMGTTMIFALLSTQLKYNNIIKTVFAMAPMARAKGMRSPLRFIAPFRDQIYWWMSFFSNGEVLNNSPMIKFFAKYVCSSDPLNMLCSNLFFVTCGYNKAQFNVTRLPVFLHHTPAGSSLQALLHLSQCAAVNEFQWHDFGAKKNLKVYGQLTPPIYSLDNVKSKVMIFWGENDLASSRSDISWLATKLDNLVLKYRIPDNKFSHVDFLWAIDVKTLVYDKLIEMILKVNKS